MNLPVAYLSSEELDAWADRPYYTRPWYNDAKVKIPASPFAHNKQERKAYNHIEKSEDPYVTEADREELHAYAEHGIEVNRKQERAKLPPVHSKSGLIAAYNSRDRSEADRNHFWESVRLFLMMNLYGSVFAGEGGYRNIKEIKSVEDFVHDRLTSVFKNKNSARSAETFYGWLQGLGRNTQRAVHKEYAVVRKGEDRLTAHLKQRKMRVRNEVALMGTSNSEQQGDGLGTTFQESDEAIEATNKEDLRKLRIEVQANESIFHHLKGLDYAILELLSDSAQFGYEHIAQFCSLSLNALKKRIERIRRRVAKVVEAEAEGSMKAA